MRHLAEAVAAVAAGLVIAAVLGVLNTSPDYDCPDGTIVVEYGDTAWALLGEHCKGNRSAALHAANWPPVLQPGMVLQLP